MHRKHIGIVLLVLVSLFVYGCNGKDMSSAEYLKQGVELYEQGKYTEAEIKIKNAIQKDPKFSDAYYYLALLNEKAQKIPAMKENLIQAVKLDENNLKAKIKLGKINLVYNELDKAKKQVEAVLAVEPDNLDALSLQASILIREKQYDKASEIVEVILQKNAEFVDAISLKVILMVKKNLLDDASALLISALQTRQDNIPLRLLKIQVDSQRNDMNAVVEGYETIAKLKPSNLQVRSALAKVYLKANQNKKAEQIFRAIAEENPKNMKARIELLDFLYLKNEQEALSQLQNYVSENKENVSNLMIYSRWLVGKKQFDKAEGVLNDLVKSTDISDKEKDAALLLLAKIKIANNDFDTGLAYVDQIIKHNKNIEAAKLLKAKIFITKGRYAEAGKLLEEILWQKPRMDVALSLLGEVNVLQGELIKANANFQDALKYNPRNVVALNHVVAQAIKEKNLDYAIKTLEKTLKYMPGQLSILAKLVNLNIEKQDWEQAKQYILQIQAQKKGIVYAKYLQAKLLQKQKKFKEANELYQAILDKTPLFTDALNGLAESYSELNQQAELLGFLDAFLTKNPNVSEAYILKSRLLSANKKNTDSIKLLEGALKQKEIDSAAIYTEIARIYSILGKKDKVYQAYQDGLRKRPDDVDLLLLLASLYEKDTQFDKARNIYEKILDKTPRQKVASNNLAALLVDHFAGQADIDKAMKLVESFKQSDQPYYLDTYGWVQFRQGNVNEALSVFKKVIILEPDVPVFHYHLALAYQANDDSMTAISELGQAIFLGRKKSFPEKSQAEKLLKELKNR